MDNDWWYLIEQERLKSDLHLKWRVVRVIIFFSVTSLPWPALVLRR